eukprot:scaffold1239_cov175-Pinguiococcus_pyrenoidosus.AAC.49
MEQSFDVGRSHPGCLCGKGGEAIKPAAFLRCGVLEPLHDASLEGYVVGGSFPRSHTGVQVSAILTKAEQLNEATKKLLRMNCERLRLRRTDVLSQTYPFPGAHDPRRLVLEEAVPETPLQVHQGDVAILVRSEALHKVPHAGGLGGAQQVRLPLQLLAQDLQELREGARSVEEEVLQIPAPNLAVAVRRDSPDELPDLAVGEPAT